jgi:hypothetical protein
MVDAVPSGGGGGAPGAVGSNAQVAGSVGLGAAAGGATLEHGKMALILWCRSMAAGFDGVDIVDFGDSWQDGLAFCAILSRSAHTKSRLFFQKTNQPNHPHRRTRTLADHVRTPPTDLFRWR